MNELISPFIRLWNYTGTYGGFPGQVFFCVAVVMLIIGGFTWLGNKKGA